MMTVKAVTPTHQPSGGGTDVDFDAVIPALLQCFAIIFAGYLARKMSLLASGDVKGIRVLVVYFLMPMMIIQAILTVHWDKVNWRFIACVFVAKTLVFVAVAAVTLALSNDLAKSGLYGIFATHSNDMALGCPLVRALYGSSHSEYIDYLYLLMPINLLILNPIGFLMMEIEAQRRSSSSTSGGTTNSPTRFSVIARVLWAIMTNPMMLSTVIGIVGSIALGRRHVPHAIDAVLGGFSSAFTTVALFALGCTLCSNGTAELHSPISTAILLSLAKVLLLPLLLRELISVMNISRNDSELVGLDIFGFLYGLLPTAPTVFVFACQYGVALEQTSTSLAMVTLISAPWMYLSSKMMSITHLDSAQYESVLSNTEFDSAIICIAGSALCLIIYLMTRKTHRVPHFLVFYFLIACIISSVGILIGEPSSSAARLDWRRITSRTLVIWGRYSTWAFAVSLALTQTILRTTGLCMVLRLRSALVLIGYCAPLFLAISIVLAAEMASKTTTQSTQFVQVSAYVSAAVVILCLILNVILLICQYKCGRLESCVHTNTETAIEEPPAPIDDDDEEETTTVDVERQMSSDVPDIEDNLYGLTSSKLEEPEDPISSGDQLRLLDSDDEPSTSANVRLMCASNAQCSSEQRYKCKRLLRHYRRQTRPVVARTASMEPPDVLLDACNDSDAYEITKHSFLVAFTSTSMAVSLFVALWQSVRSETDCGTFLQLRLVETVFYYGQINVRQETLLRLLHFQPVVVLILFGVDGSWLLVLKKQFRRYFRDSDKLMLPNVDEIDQTTRKIGDQFSRSYLSQCSAELLKTVRIALKRYENVFYGAELVDWLIKKRVVKDRTSAVKYGRRLVLCRMIEHTDQEEHFYDSTTLLYRFITPSRTEISPLHSC